MVHSRTDRYCQYGQVLAASPTLVVLVRGFTHAGRGKPSPWSLSSASSCQTIQLYTQQPLHSQVLGAQGWKDTKLHRHCHCNAAGKGLSSCWRSRFL